MYNGRCTNCHEELFIVDQYIEEGMQLPDPESDFMKKVDDQLYDVQQKEIYRAAELSSELEAKERNKKRWPHHYNNE